MNRLRANRLCQANSLMTRTGRRYVGIGAGVTVLHEELVRPGASSSRSRCSTSKCAGVHRPVDFSPRDVRFARRLADDELVVGRTAGMLARAAGQRPVGGNHAFPTAHRLLVERGRRQVPANAIGANPFAFEARTALNSCAHPTTPKICTRQSTYAECASIVTSRSGPSTIPAIAVNCKRLPDRIVMTL